MTICPVHHPFPSNPLHLQFMGSAVAQTSQDMQTAFNHNWVPMSCLQPLNNTNKGWTNNNIQWIHQQLWSQFLVPHNTLNGTMSPWAWCSSRCSYTALAVSVYTKLPCCSLQWSIMQSFLLQICIAREAVFLKLCEYASLARWSSPIAGWVAHLGKLWWS